MNLYFPRITPAYDAIPMMHQTQQDRALLARAVQLTRVSYFDPKERERLSELVTLVTGYTIEGGL